MSAIQQTLLAYGASAPLVVSDVFSATNYTGTGAAQTITNGIDLAGKGGMFWIKNRSSAVHIVVDTQRGNGKRLQTQSTSVESSGGSTYAAATNSGFSISTNSSEINAASNSYISWTFRIAPKFFDVVTYTGNGYGARYTNCDESIAPSLIIAKSVSGVGDWFVWHKDMALGSILKLNSAAAIASDSTVFTTYPVGYGYFYVNNLLNANGVTYVAYVFNHDAGADGFIQCGKYTGNGSATGPTVTLGWEPQFLMIKNASGTGDWVMYDSARDATNPRTATLLANSSAAESVVGPDIDFTSAGFQIKSSATNVNTSGSTYIYMAIRKP